MGNGRVAQNARLQRVRNGTGSRAQDSGWCVCNRLAPWRAIISLHHQFVIEYAVGHGAELLLAAPAERVRVLTLEFIPLVPLSIYL